MKLSVQLILAFSLILILSLADSLSNYFLSVKVKENTEFLSRSQEIMRNSASLHKMMIVMQSSFRGYLLTHDSTFLAGYEEGLRRVPVLIKEQKKLVNENSHQKVLLDSVDFLHEEWTDYSNTLIRTTNYHIENGDMGKVNPVLYIYQFKNQIGKKINDQISEKFLAFDRAEYKQRSVHSANLMESIERTHTFSILFFSLTMLVGVMTTIYIISFILKRIRTMVHLAENISQGNFTTLDDKRNDELTSLSASLNIMSNSLSRNINKLEKQNLELDKFAYVVSHDLKAPLRGIHNVVKWIGEDMKNEVTPELKKYLEIISQRISRMEDLINGLLEYARTREQTSPEVTHVDQLVTEIVETIVPRSFEVRVSKLPVMVTEKLKLEQIFTNLISNAVKYSISENGRIEISCKEFRNHYEFSVKDNGVGIDPEYHHKIFELFQTLREKNEKESTGIGLAIIKKILDDQHCRIKVKSDLGKGSEFIFTWPRIENMI